MQTWATAMRSSLIVAWDLGGRGQKGFSPSLGGRAGGFWEITSKIGGFV